MRLMREIVAENNVYRWAANIVSTLVRIEPTDAQAAPPPAEDNVSLPDKNCNGQHLALVAGTW
jgi:hypothetical protein